MAEASSNQQMTSVKLVVAAKTDTSKAAQVSTRLLAVAALVFFLLTAFRAGYTHDETDFPNYYTAAVAEGRGLQLHNFYDWTWFQRQMNYAGFERQLGAYTPQTPLTMLPFLELTRFAPQTAKCIWLICNLIFLGATVWLLSRVTQFRAEQIALVAFCGYGSLYMNFLYGQYYVFLLLLLTLAFYCLQKKQPAAGGFILGMVFGLKLYGGPFLIYFVAKRNWKAVAGMTTALFLACLAAVAMFGWKDIVFYVTQILPRSLEGGSVDPYHPGNPTLSTLLRHTFMLEPELNPQPLWNAPWLFFSSRTLVLFGLVVFTFLGLALNRDGKEKRDFAWFVLAVLLLATSVASYTFLILLLPVILLLDEESRPMRIAFLACFVVLCSPLPSSLDRFFPKVWVLLALYFIAGRPNLRLLRPKLVVAASTIVVLAVLLDARRHVISYGNEPGQRFERVAEEKGELFASSPAVSPFGLFYQAMGNDRYVLGWVHDNGVEKVSFEGESLNPVAAADGRIRFELVSNGHSKIMEFNPLNHEVAQVASSVPVESKIDSKVSPDGKWEIFVAGSGGSQQIWIRDLATGKAEQLTGGTCNSVAPEWELDSSGIVFASDCGRAYGLPALYRARIVNEITSNAAKRREPH
jgi:Glycosyltransferase family 87